MGDKVMAIDRFVSHDKMQQWSAGPWVRHSDYVVLQLMCDALQTENQALLARIDELEHR